MRKKIGQKRFVSVSFFSIWQRCESEFLNIRLSLTNSNFVKPTLTMHTCTALTVSNEEWRLCNSSEVQTSLQKPKKEEESLELDLKLVKTLLQNCWEDRKHIAGLSGNFSTTLKLLKPLTLAAFSALSTYQIIQKMKSFLRIDITLLKRFNEMKTHFLKKKTLETLLSTFWNIFSVWTQ